MPSEALEIYTKVVAKKILSRTKYVLPRHSSLPRAWLNTECPIKGTTIGLELELEATADRYPICEKAHLFGAVAERDATLHEYRGVEIVFPPFSSKTILAKNGPIAKFLESIKEDTPLDMPQHVGNHINVGSRTWSEKKKNLFCVFFIAAKHPCQFMADRVYKQFYKWEKDSFYHICNFDHLQHGANCGKRDQGRPGDRLEITIFKGTRDPQRLKRRIQFVCAVEKYVEAVLAISGNSLDAGIKIINKLFDDPTHFYDWLAKETHPLKYRAYKDFLALSKVKEFVDAESLLKKATA